jgi:hypothetical protein
MRKKGDDYNDNDYDKDDECDGNNSEDYDDVYIKKAK